MQKLLLTLTVLLTTVASPALERQSDVDYHARRLALAKLMDGGALVLFAPTEAEGQNNLYGFRQDDNFYYLTGWPEPGAALLINSNPYREVLFLPEHNLTQEKWTGPKLGPRDPDAARRSGFDKVAGLDSMHDMLLEILPQPRAIVYSDLGSASPATGPVEWLRRGNSFPNYVAFRDVKPTLARLRMVKDAGELQLITHAVEASAAAHRAAIKAIHPEVTEREISALMQYEFGKRGCERPAYAPIVGSGFESTVLHYSADSGTMKSGDVVVMDVAGEYSMYASDITRTVPVNGKFTPASARSMTSFWERRKPPSRHFRPGSPSWQQGTTRIRSTKSPSTTSTRTAKTCAASRSGSTSFMASATTSA
jgi:Xaa-Pro aminopeptidase